jgi:putative endonuclease
MYYANIMYSPSTDRFYKGHTSQTPEKRVERHNKRITSSTRTGIPWTLVFFKSFDTKREAIQFEIFLKKQKNRDFFERMIQSTDNEKKK